MSGQYYKILAVSLSLVFISIFPKNAVCSWNEINEILKEAYGEETARQCRDYYSSLNVPEEQIGSVREAIGRLVEAEYPSGCPKEYLRLVGELSRAGIQLSDLTNKIREGIAKKVSPERLTSVLTHRAEALMEARIVTLKLIDEGTEFLDRQMTYTVIADYLLRGVKSEELRSSVSDGDLKRFPALENLIR